MPVSEPPRSPSYVITLVHGTWADTRGWVAPGSPLRRELERQLGSVEFREFPWISAHTHAARAEAGARLAQFIRGGHARYPDARHIVIGHSHGGLVALYAMRDPEADRAISGIVTLATPFPSARPRRLHPYVSVAAFLLIAAPAVMGALVLWSFPQLGAGRLPWVAGAVAAMVAGDARLTKWLIGFCRRRQREAMASLRTPPVDPERLLILCPRIDEVRGWLRLWDRAANAPFVVAGSLLTVAGVVAQVLMHPSARPDGVGVLGTAALVTIASLLFSGVLRRLGYGPEWTWAHLLVAIDSERTPSAPAGCGHVVHELDVSMLTDPGQRAWRRLRHKAIRQSPEVTSAISSWLARA